MLKRNEWNYNGYTWIHPDGRSLKTHVMLKAGEIKRIRTVASYKPQAPSSKPQATSSKRQAAVCDNMSHLHKKKTR